MVNKPSIAALVDDFVAGTDDALGHWLKLHRLLLHDLPARRTISENCLSSLVQNWESFRSDWQVAAVTRDSSAFLEKLARAESGAVETALRAKYPASSIVVDLGLGQHPSRATIAALLDADGKNVTYNDKQKHDRTVAMQLTPAYKAKIFSITADDWLLLDLARECRNAIAHRSTASLSRFNEAIHEIRGSKIDSALGGRASKVRETGIGTYLYGSVSSDNSQARVMYIGERIRDIGEKLR